MKRLPTMVVGGLLPIAVLLTTAARVDASPARSDAELRVARAATSVYHDPAVAIAAGYVSTQECVEVPGLGVMGQHWVNPDLLTTDPAALDPAEPQALLYVPTGDSVRLVAIEYIVFAPDRVPAANPDQRDPNGPKLFGQYFNGLMAGHSPGMPTHWDLHVWLWAHNPAGMFAPYNPSREISC